jgi:hypothetical protein
MVDVCRRPSDTVPMRTIPSLSRIASLAAAGDGKIPACDT